jgi:hypothetical protein
MKKGDKIWVDECPRDHGELCDYEGIFERVADDSYFFACPKCGWEVTDQGEGYGPVEL